MLRLMLFLATRWTALVGSPALPDISGCVEGVREDGAGGVNGGLQVFAL
jgi:hypothetical protein